MSTSTIGWCVIDKKGSFVDAGYIPLTKIKSLVEKGRFSSDEFGSIIIKHDIQEIYIEECMQRFSRGMSSAATITKLAMFNGIIQYVANESIGVQPQLLNVNQARKAIGLKVQSQKKCGIPTKEQVMNFVKPMINFNWPTKTLQSGPRKGMTIDIPECYDMADAYVIAKAGFVHCKN